MSKNTICVIIPAYNAERTIATAINSVLACRNVSQVICIDDGSSDDTYSLACSCHDERVEVLKQANSGVSRARNAGLLKARTDYVAFLDADDSYDAKRLDTLIDRLPERLIDVIVFGVSSYVEGKDSSSALPDVAYLLDVLENYEMTGVEFASELMQKGTELGSSCRALFLKRFLMENDISFYPNMRISEDTLFCRQALLLSEKVLNYHDNILLRCYNSSSCTGQASDSDYIVARLLLRYRYKEFVSSRDLTEEQKRFSKARIERDAHILQRDVTRLTMHDYMNVAHELGLEIIDRQLYELLLRSVKHRKVINACSKVLKLGINLLRKIR